MVPFAKPTVSCGPPFAFDHSFLKHVLSIESTVFVLMKGNVFDNFQKVSTNFEAVFECF